MSTIVGLGIDLVEVSRLEAALGRWGDRLLRRLFTEGELLRAGSRGARAARLAARFAAKEAVMKALGVGWRAMGWREIEIRTDVRGRPHVVLHGNARAQADRLDVAEIVVSLTHSAGVAVANAVALRR